MTEAEFYKRRDELELKIESVAIGIVDARNLRNKPLHEFLMMEHFRLIKEIQDLYSSSNYIRLLNQEDSADGIIIIQEWLNGSI